MSTSHQFHNEMPVALRFRYVWIGNALAAGTSYATWHSLWWAMLHGFLGWAYIAYWAVSRYAR